MNSNGREEKSKEEFSRIASNYEKGIWGMYFRFSYRQVLKKCRSYFKQNIKILDIGCGPGGLELLLTKFIRKYELLGLDISPQMIMTARQRVLDKNNKITFSVGRANKIPSPNSYFDIAFCLNTFHHLPEQKNFLLEINRVLKPEGIFVVLDVTSDTIIRKIWIKIYNSI